MGRSPGDRLLYQLIILPATLYTTMICASVPSRPRRIMVITVGGGIALPLSSGLVRLLPFASPYELYNFRANRATRVCIAVWRACRWCPVAVRTLRRTDMSAPVTTCRHHLPVGFLWSPLSQRATRRAGRAAA